MSNRSLVCDGGLNVYYQNVRGLNSKVGEFYCSVQSSEFHVICIAESWLSEDVASSELFDDNYTVFRSDRAHRKGGVILAVRNDLSFSSIDLPDYFTIPFVDIACVRIHLNSRSLIIFVVYITSPTNTEYYVQLTEAFEQFELLYSQSVIILGDFNVPEFCSYSRSDNNLKAELLCSLQDFFDFSQFNEMFNQNNRLLDLVFSNIQCHVEHEIAPFVREDSHHPALFIQCLIDFRSGVHDNFPVNHDQERFNFRKANFPALYSELLSEDWQCLDQYNQPDLYCSLFYEKLFNIIRRWVPVVKSRNTGRGRYPDWFDADIICKLRQKNRAFRQYKKTGCVRFLEQFKTLRATTKKLVKKAYSQFLVKIQGNIRSDPASFWRFIGSKNKASRIPCRMHGSGGMELTDPGSITDAFMKYFHSVYEKSHTGSSLGVGDEPAQAISLPMFTESDVIRSAKRMRPKMSSGPDGIPYFLVKDCASALSRPLTKLFNLSVKSLTFPTYWKTAKICAIHKKGDKSDITNYRPVSLLCGFSKLFEMCIYESVYPKVRSLISPHQHGFMTHRSSVTNLAVFSQYVSEVIHDKGQIDVIYTDFSKAFDKIDHSIMISKLINFGFNSSMLVFFRSYLQGRLQYMEYQGYKSPNYEVTSGVPQGSNLGPLLFLMFIDDITERLCTQFSLFADDLKLFTRVESTQDCHFVQNTINLLNCWCKENKLKLNITKCSVMSITLKKSPIIYNYSIDGSQLHRTYKVRDLGVIYNSAFNFNDHVLDLAASATKTMGFIIRNCREFTDIQVLKTLYYTLINSKIEYCCLIWSPYYSVYINCFERLQRRFMKFMAYKSDGVYPPQGFSNEDLLKRFNMLSPRCRRELLTCTFAHSLVNSRLDCQSLRDKLITVTPRPGSRNARYFYAPLATTNTEFNSPIYRISTVFNRYHHCASFTDSLSTFKSKILQKMCE